MDSVDLDKAKYLCSLPKVLGQHPENKQDITLNSGRFGPYLKCENKSARLENVEELFSIGLNRAITLIAEAKPGRISSLLIKDLGEHRDGGCQVNVMDGKYGPYVKWGKINATLPKDAEPTTVDLETAMMLISEKSKKGTIKKKKRKKS